MNALAVKSNTVQRMAIIAHRTDNAIVGAIKALMVENLKEKMRGGVAEFLFLKKDGSLRQAFGTTKSAIAGKHTNGRGESREFYGTTAYFDVEVGAWRSFRWENLVAVY